MDRPGWKEDANAIVIVGESSGVGNRYAISFDGNSETAPLLTIEYCLQEPYTIGDLVWENANGNGVADLGESGLPDVALKLAWWGENQAWAPADDLVEAATYTDASGLYQFLPLRSAGEYRVGIHSTSFGVDGALYGFQQTFPETVPFHTIVYPSINASHSSADFGFEFQNPTDDHQVTGPEIFVEDGQVQVNWQTINEVDLLGFHLYRDGQGENELIHTRPAEYGGLPMGFIYTYSDMEADPGSLHTYWLEVLTRQGSTFLVPGLINQHRKFLPLLRY